MGSSSTPTPSADTSAGAAQEMARAANFARRWTRRAFIRRLEALPGERHRVGVLADGYRREHLTAREVEDGDGTPCRQHGEQRVLRIVDGEIRHRIGNLDVIDRDESGGVVDVEPALVVLADV